ncbi:MAG: DUF2076 domain-containing protein [Tardiphaga sp.]
MTPQERQLVDDLFDRLSKVEAAPREPDAQAVIAEGQRRAPNAIYALVQTVLLQDEALKRAHERITELEGQGAPEQAAPGGFLDSMRDALFGQSNPAPNQPRGSVPNVRPGDTGRPAWNTGQVMGQPQQQGYGQPGYGQQGQYGQPPMGQQAPQPGRGGSFLGTAAAAAAGMVGGSLLMNSLGGMFGGGKQQGFGDSANASESKSPWSSDSSGGDLAKEAGVNDIGNSSGQRSGNYDQAQADIDQDQDQDQDDHDDMDMDSDDFGDSDNA